LTLSAAETAATEDSNTQSDDDDVSDSKDSEREDELLLEFGDANNSDENDSKNSESEEEDQLSEGARVNRYGRKGAATNVSQYWLRKCIQTIVTMEPSPKTIELRANKIQ